MRKYLAMLLSFVMMFTVVAACDNGKDSDDDKKTTKTEQKDDQNKTEKPEPKEKVTITLWTMAAEDTEETSSFQRLKRVAEAYNKSNEEGITIDLSGAKTADVILTTVASGGDPDIFQNYWNNAPTWSDTNALYDLTDFVNNDKEWNKDDIIDRAWNLCTYNDRIYSIPMVASTTVMAYRTDILKEAGWDKVPETMEELVQCIYDTTIVGDDGKLERLGMVPNMPWMDNVLWPAAYGAPWMDGDAPNFNNEQMIKAYQFQRDIYDKYGYDEIARMKDSFGQQATADDPMFKGQVAMAWMLDNWLASLEEFGKDVEWVIAPMPTDNEHGGQMLTVGVWEMNSKTEDPEAAWKVLAEITSEEAMKDYAMGSYDYGTFMARESALKYIRDEADVSDIVKQVADMFLSEEMISFPMLSYTGEYLSAIGSEMDLAMVGDQTVEEAAQNVQDQIMEISQEK